MIILKINKMTVKEFKEAKSLYEMIEDYNNTIDFLKDKTGDDLRSAIISFLNSNQFASKNQMQEVMYNAVLESCELCIKQAKQALGAL